MFFYERVWYNGYMKIIRTLEITNEDFFNYLEHDLIDIIAKTGKTITAKDIKKGLKYTTHGEDHFAKVEVTLMEYERGVIYKSRMKSMEDTITLSYTIEEDPKGIKVTFEQKIQSFETKKMNRLMKGWSEAIYLGRMSDALYEIQKKAIQLRDGIVEKPVEKKNHKLIQKLVEKK